MSPFRCLVSTWIVVGTAGSGVSTLGTIGADEAAEAAKGASVVGSFGTITNVVADVQCGGSMRDGSLVHRDERLLPAMQRNDDPCGYHNNQPWSGANATTVSTEDGTE